VLVGLSLSPAMAAGARLDEHDGYGSGSGPRIQQEKKPGRGDDLALVQSWRTFLDSASRAFFAAGMNTEAVKAKVKEADERIEVLEAAPADDAGGRGDITADVPFLERAQRAFTAAHMNTAAVNKWLEEAREGSGD
jgi:hypothetical protein